MYWFVYLIICYDAAKLPACLIVNKLKYFRVIPFYISWVEYVNLFIKIKYEKPILVISFGN